MYVCVCVYALLSCDDIARSHDDHKKALQSTNNNVVYIRKFSLLLLVRVAVTTHAVVSTMMDVILV